MECPKCRAIMKKTQKKLRRKYTCPSCGYWYEQTMDTYLMFHDSDDQEWRNKNSGKRMLFRMRVTMRNPQHVHVNFSTNEISNGRLVFTPEEWREIKNTLGNKIEFVEDI